MKFIIFNFNENSSNVTESMSEETTEMDLGTVESIGDLGTFTHEWYDVEVEIPILPAFSVVYFWIRTGCHDTHFDRNVLSSDTKLKFYNGQSVKQEHTDITIALYYSGIRDYSHLFHWVDEEALRVRLGEFYEEAEKSFDNASWLSFALMCGAIFEGILYAKGYRNGLESKINKALEESVIDSHTAAIMHNVRGFRNLVHAYKFNEPKVSRADAMDIRSVLDKLLIQF